MDFPDLLDVPLELPVVCAHGLVPGRKFWLCKIFDSQSQYTRVEVYCVVRFLVVHMYIKVQEVPGAGYLEEGCGKVPTGWGYPDTSCAIGRAVVKSSFLTAFKTELRRFCLHSISVVIKVWSAIIYQRDSTNDHPLVLFESDIPIERLDRLLESGFWQEEQLRLLGGVE